eukprot:gene2513-7201_t
MAALATEGGPALWLYVAPGVVCGAPCVWPALSAVRRIALLRDEQVRERPHSLSPAFWDEVTGHTFVARSLATQVLPLFPSCSPGTVANVEHT